MKRKKIVWANINGDYFRLFSVSVASLVGNQKNSIIFDFLLQNQSSVNTISSMAFSEVKALRYLVFSFFFSTAFGHEVIVKLTTDFIENEIARNVDICDFIVCDSESGKFGWKLDLVLILYNEYLLEYIGCGK